MCTLIASVGQVPGLPIVVAANRDEALDRPSSPPSLWHLQPPFIAPRDERAGGTWLGLNRSGLFVGITNRFGVPKHDDRESRGTLVTKALAHKDVLSLHAAFAAVAPKLFNAFHLFYADTTGAAAVTWTDGEKLEQLVLKPGLHVITERSFDAADQGRADYVRAHWPAGEGDAPDPEALQKLLQHHHDSDPLAAPCVHAPQFNYGTRSSMVLFLRPTLAKSQLWWAEGSPCQNAFVEDAALIDALVRAE